MFIVVPVVVIDVHSFSGYKALWGICLELTDVLLLSHARPFEGSADSVFNMVWRTGVPITRSMAMLWVLAWQEVPEGTKANARLVATGFIGPDLLTIRAEAPT